MPNIKSAKKRVLISEKKQGQNKMIKSEVKTVIKNIDLLIKNGNLEEAEKALPATYAAIDSACAKGVIKKNTAANKKSGVAKLLAKAKAAK